MGEPINDPLHIEQNSPMKKLQSGNEMSTDIQNRLEELQKMKESNTRSFTVNSLFCILLLSTYTTISRSEYHFANAFIVVFMMGVLYKMRRGYNKEEEEGSIRQENLDALLKDYPNHSEREHDKKTQAILEEIQYFEAKYLRAKKDRFPMIVWLIYSIAEALIPFVVRQMINNGTLDCDSIVCHSCRALRMLWNPLIMYVAYKLLH